MNDPRESNPMAAIERSLRLFGDHAAASSPQGLADRRELALIAVERTRTSMAVTDPRQPDDPMVLANRAFLKLTGYAADEIIGRNCRLLQGADTDPNAVEEIRAAIAAARETTVTLLNYRKDGTSFWNELHISPIHDDDGALLYFFSSQRDVSALREVERLADAELRLLREVDHRAKNALALVQGIVRLTRATMPRRIRFASSSASMRWRGRTRCCPNSVGATSRSIDCCAARPSRSAGAG